MRTRVRGWRWRRNPLRRRSDVVEAWTVLVGGGLLLVGAPLAGAARRPVGPCGRAWPRRPSSGPSGTGAGRGRGQAARPLPTAEGGRNSAYRVAVRWTEPGGARAPGHRARARRAPHRGDMVDVWLDARGRSVAPPPDATAVWQHTVTLGMAAAGGTAAVVLLGHAVVRRVTSGTGWRSGNGSGRGPGRSGPGAGRESGGRDGIVPGPGVW